MPWRDFSPTTPPAKWAVAPFPVGMHWTSVRGHMLGTPATVGLRHRPLRACEGSPMGCSWCLLQTQMG